MLAFSLKEILLRLHILWVCEVSQKNLLEEFRDILEFLQNGYNWIFMNFKLNLMQTNLLLFRCFRNVFITYYSQFANDPYRFYTDTA